MEETMAAQSTTDTRTIEAMVVAQTTHAAMGTLMTHKIFGPHAGECLAAVCREIAWLEALLSRFDASSDIGRINESAGIRIESVCLETYDLLSTAIDFSRRFPGCFDVTIGPLVSLWSAGRKASTPPADADIRQVLALIDYRDLTLEPGEIAAGLASAGQSVDLGGIGKGFAGDKIAEIYERFGVTSAFSNLGGNVVTRGARPDGSPWRIGIQHPRQEDRLIGAVGVIGKTVVTSGDYQRFFIDSTGKRRHHILNPTTGYPAESGLISVSIVAESATAADALSTIIFVAGLERGAALIRDYPGVEAILVDDRLRIYVTEGLREDFVAAEDMTVTVLE